MGELENEWVRELLSETVRDNLRGRRKKDRLSE